jgi:pimeloyl-ACP methyl ester carboxylesterase
VSIPAAVTVFPGENYEAPRSWAERAYHKLIHYNKVDKGGHYAAWEQPQLFSQEVRAAQEARYGTAFALLPKRMTAFRICCRS